MEAPIGPSDPEQRNIIDKLSDFVARNGQEFESLTKEKQRDNPKFAFLQGGEFYDYYKFKVEEARKRWQSQRPPKDFYPQVSCLNYRQFGHTFDIFTEEAGKHRHVTAQKDVIMTIGK
ncbi:Calcium homeostasis endoplasmic reticulum protein [Fasciolopsis buskii]|uniref:Calcium homeostasis endoplasmic reticulum protein n=1 Tax=Fasciolopsis buskii TaxID=27845 RepID=A0A8E0S1L1_9TREM|nr:Calcium homeostasis endoplasmic reticulum protein [Fasciolopsis buski]